MQLAVEKDLPSNEEVVEQRTGNLEKKVDLFSHLGRKDM